MKTLIRKYYRDLKIGDEVEVQAYYGRLTENFYMGTITNMDGQNIVVRVQGKEINEVVDGTVMSFREYEACNPEFAIVQHYYPEEL